MKKLLIIMLAFLLVFPVALAFADDVVDGDVDEIALIELESEEEVVFTVEEVLPLESLAFAVTEELQAGALGAVLLITGSEIEIEYNTPVLSDMEAHKLFTIFVDGVPAKWEYLSYFDFGPYAARGGVVNVRLAEPLDIGQIRARCRESAANA
ncbi:MAG: hypothetical protein FWG61_00860, partial [Firmicutes bacterium]|nr:hypothetical protein [Bacillota bacterium]